MRRRRAAPSGWRFVLLVAVGALAIVSMLTLTPRFRVVESRLFDSYLRVLAPPRVSDRALIVGIDDRAIEQVGEWPWSRRRLADGIVTLAEFSPARILLDIELSEASPLLVDRVAAQRLLEEGAQPSRATIAELLEDRDRALAAAIEAAGMVHVPVVIEERAQLTVRRPLPMIREAASGVGFANLEIDPDGVSRRVDLLRLVEGERFQQLALGTGAVRLDPDWTPDFDDRGRLVNAYVSFIDRDERRFEAPLDPEGYLLIRWPRTTFAESFEAFSWATLIDYREAMEDLTFNLRLMERAGYLGERHETVLRTADAAAATLAEALDEGTPGLLAEYRQLRRAFAALAGSYLQGNAEQQLMSELDRLAAAAPDAAARADVEAVRTDVREVFAATRGIHAEVVRLSAFLESSLSERVAMVGYTATSTIDLGVTPFDESFPNIGLHATVLSMLETRDFLDRQSPWPALAIGAGWLLAVALVLRRASGATTLALTFAAAVLPPVAVGVILATTRMYIPVLALTLPAFSCALTLLAQRYLAALSDRRLIQTTFEHYLAPEVIDELIRDPARIGVGGDERRLTAMFTDITAFSRVSELLDAQHLVDLLNEYLTEMTDVIVEQRGTIDKYEGDAIIAFFGAPVEVPDQADRACAAAVRMKKLEAVLNDRLIKQGLSPMPLVTRIGINTGEMIVGNLGTNRRMNYTIMGQAVNLAARLESVNKQYGTAICISDATHRELSEGFLTRRMDRVRVKGTDTPVRLYELIGMAAESTAPMREALELFEAGLEDFEQREWERAGQRFETVLRIYPDDGPARLFRDRCAAFRDQPPRESWDGVIALAAK